MSNEYAAAVRLIEHFFWNDLCDNYLELAKGRAYGDIGNAANRRSARYTCTPGATGRGFRISCGRMPSTQAQWESRS
jgi:valyl-tRNA synthetase